MIALFVGAAIITGLGLERLNDDDDEVERIQTGVAMRDNSNALHMETHLQRMAARASRSLPSPSEEPVSAPVLVTPAPLTVQRTVTVQLTIYVCQNAPPGQSYCGTMASGKRVYEGAAACGSGLALGTRFRFDREYVCEDRGNGPAYWVDIFFWDYYAGQAWRKQFGQTVEIEVSE